MFDLFELPGFARLVDYIGVWCIEPTRAAILRELAKSINLSAHIEQKAEPLRSITDKVAASGGKSISVISLTGLLMKSQTSLGGTSTVQARREIRTAANDPDIGGLVIRADSPGGTSAGTSDLADEIRAAARKKPVVGQVEDLAASAAVWALTWADKIYANASTALYGSIGTYQVLFDSSGNFEAQGVKTILVATGPLKGMGTEGTKISEEQVAHVQGLVNAVQASFDAAVQKSRNLNGKQLAAVRHGGVMTAPAAIEAGLIDGIQPIAKTINDLSAAIKSGDPRRSTDNGAQPVVGTLPTLRRGLPMLTNSRN